MSTHKKAVIIDERPDIAEQASRFLAATAPQLTVSPIVDVVAENLVERIFREDENSTPPDLFFLASHAQDYYAVKYNIDLVSTFRQLAPASVIALHSGRGKPLSHGADVFISVEQLVGRMPSHWINSLCSYLEKKKGKEAVRLIVPAKRAISVVNEKLWRKFRNRPDLLRSVTPRRFEEIVADLFKEEGYEILLTPPGKDGGKDIYAYRRDGVSNLCYVVECKRYTPPHKVGVEIARQLYGVIQNERVSGGVIVTTSYFTSGAAEFAGTLPYQLFLKDFDDLSQWLASADVQS